MTTAPTGGLFASLRRLAATAIEIVHVRLELLLVEVEQEKLRLFDALLWAGAGLLALGIGTLLLCAFIVMLFDDALRPLALGVLTLMFIGAGAWALLSARARLRSPGGLLRASVDELAQDRAGLAPPDAARAADATERR